jgi:hypothetical protein
MNVVTNRKYYCLEPENFIKFAEFLGFKRVSDNEVVDEYFIDSDSNFIKNLNLSHLTNSFCYFMELK